jgi:arginyl-tRNA synthetase
VLRPGGRLTFLVNGTIMMLRSPDDADALPSDRLVRDYFGMHRFEWPDWPSAEFHPGYGDWIRLLRANGFYTYYAVDIAYHRNKFIERGFDRVIDVWGADHHGHSIRFKATMSAPALDIDSSKLDFLIMQMVRLTRDGETIKVSKRTGNAITLNDLLDEISVDACRFFFNARPDTHLEFDMGLAVRQDSENPVYYVQYAHARITSLITALRAVGSEVPDISDVDVSKIDSEYEQELIKQIALLPEEIRLAARDYDPSRINRYVIELAARFHRFYNSNRIKGETPEVLSARLKLADATRKVIANSLQILGVTAPERM